MSVDHPQYRFYHPNNTIIEEDEFHSIIDRSAFPIEDQIIDNYNDIPIFCPQNWSFDNFEIGRIIGEGGFGKVYVAREKQSKYIVALKVMSKKMLIRSKTTLNLQREIEIQSHLNHHNILKLYGYFSTQKSIVLILEYAAEGQLFSIMRNQPRGRFSEDIASRYIKQVSYALQYLHSMNVIHRDIKPENLLLSGDTIKLSDFGWSIHSPSNRRKTYCGTMDYLSPEIVDNQYYDNNVDIWCLGVLAYELTSGEPPFEIGNQNVQKKKEKIRNCSFEIPHYFSKELSNFICGILVKNKRDRPSIEQILQHPWIVRYNQN